MPLNSAIVSQGTALDSVEYVLNMVRVLINDAMEDLAGDIFTDDWPAAFVYLNTAKRMVEQNLADNGVEFNIKETVLTPLPPVVNGGDPSIQVSITQEGFFDGANNHASPGLPGDMIIPLRLWERQVGQGTFVQVTPATDGLDPRSSGGQNFGCWDWRADGIYLPGASMANELRLRYISFSPELTSPNGVMPFRRSALAVAFMTAFVFANARGGASAAGFKSLADEQLDNIVSQTTRKKQRRPAQKRAYGRGRR
jgi:hypothetical protein